MRLEVEAEVKPRGVTTRDEGGERVRGELGLLWRDVERGGEDGLDSGWSGEAREVLTGERFPSCCRCCCGLREEDGVAVRVPVELLSGSRSGRVGVVGAGAEEGAKYSRVGVDGEGGKKGAGRDFLTREGEEVGELALTIEGRFGVRGAGVLISVRLDEVGGGEDGDGESFEERLTAGDESEACLSEGVTKLVNRGKRNRCWSFPSCGERLSSLSTGRASDGASATDTFLVRRRATLDSNRLSTPVRSLEPSSLPTNSVTLTSAWVPSWAEI